MKTTAIVKAGGHQAITSPAMLDRFTQYIDASPRTVESYSKAVRLFIEWTRQNGITQPRREDLLRYRDELAATHKATTVQTYLIAIRQFFKWTAAENLYTDVEYGRDRNIAVKRVYWLNGSGIEIRSACGDGWKRTFTLEDQQNGELRLIGKVVWYGNKPKNG